MDYRLVTEILNAGFRNHNYQVNPKTPTGKVGKNNKKQREFRLQLINKHIEVNKNIVDLAEPLLKKLFADAQNLKFNPVSPNSSKFPSYSFTLDNQEYDIVIARGANKGENFEVIATKNLANAFQTQPGTTEFHQLIHELNAANGEFAGLEIVRVEQRRGSTKKTGIPLEKLNEVIGDIILIDQNGGKWYISLKDVNGITFSTFPGGATLFDKTSGILNPSSEGAKFLETFGVDLAAVQAGFNERRFNTPNTIKPKNKNPNDRALKILFERAWGMNYFYVRRKTNGWEVFWIDKRKLDQLTSNIKIESIRYPSKKTKSIMILCSNQYKKYRVEMRNSAGGEYPNDIKFSLR
jgi:hypothetical protein